MRNNNCLNDVNDDDCSDVCACRHLDKRNLQRKASTKDIETDKNKI